MALDLKINDHDNDDDDLVLKATGWNHLYVPTEEKVKFAITGTESQVITISLDPDESIESEPGTMMYTTMSVQPSVRYENCCARCCAGECCYVVSYGNKGNNASTTDPAFVALTPNFPTSKVVPVDMSSPDVGGSLIAQQGAIMASYGDVKVTVSFDCNLARCCCAGTGLIRQKLVGSGTAFIAATGTIIQKVLGPDEIILMDGNNILAFSESVTIDLRRTGGIVGMIGGGEGIFNTILKGPGIVLAQSMNEIVFRQALTANKIWRR